MGRSGTVRVGLAGLGRFGKLHAAILERLAGVDLVAVCDPRPDEVAAVTARNDGIAGFGKRDGTSARGIRVGISISCVLFSVGSRTTREPWPADTA